ncbi:MAG: hypothetical protein AB9915_00485 [Candidatus Dojkabacteria bacterium]
MIHNHDFGETSGAGGDKGNGYSFDNNSYDKERGTIDSTVRIMKGVEEGRLTQEDLDVCLEANSKNLNMSVEELRELAEKELARLKPEEKAGQTPF